MFEMTSAIPLWFERQVCRTPDHLAVKTRQQAITYAALNQMANEIAWAILGQRGTGEETVAFLPDKDATFVAAFLGILKSGKIAVALDPQYPAARTSFMLEDSQAALLVPSASWPLTSSLACAPSGGSTSPCKTSSPRPPWPRWLW